jgi:transposase-like protein
MMEKDVFDKRQQVILEYLKGDASFKAIGMKYGINPRTIQGWVRAYRKLHGQDIPIAGAQEDMKGLKKQLEYARLKNELLEEMLRLSEEHTGIDLRKKFGTRQS